MRVKKNGTTVNRWQWWIFFCIGLIGLAVGCWYRHAGFRKDASPEVAESFGVMGTVASLELAGNAETAGAAQQRIHRIFEDVETRWSLFRPESELSRLNASAAEQPFACSEELWRVLRLAREAWQASDGAFDISAKPLMDLWGFYRKRGTMPTEKEIAAVLPRVGLDKIQFDDEQHSVKFTVPGMALDLGGIAKGVAVDWAKEAAVACGVKAGVINLGGNLALLPEPLPNRESYRIGVRHPLRAEQCLEVLELQNCATATSGGYERFVELEGRRYAHIMDPRTGRPAEQMLAVTVIAPSAGQADWMSTAVFVGGEAIGRRLTERYPDTRMLLCFEDGSGGVRVVRLPVE